MARHFKLIISYQSLAWYCVPVSWDSFIWSNVKIKIRDDKQK